MILGFGEYQIDTDRRELRRAEEPLHVEPQVFDLILYLAENRDRVISKDELFERVWKRRVVSDATLSSRINAARRALGDSGDKQSVIRTVSRRGFRFTVEVSDAATGQAAHAGAMRRHRRTLRSADPVTG
jgi:DNA-binding winged helix-turn-helix (wHTH) protein